MNTAPARHAPHTWFHPADTTTATRDVSTTPHRWPPGFTTAAGAFYFLTAGMHIGIVMADTELYRGFAGQSPWGLVRTGWADIFMANPQLWGLFAAALELLLGILLLVGGRLAKIGWVGIVAFQAALVLFGWGYLWWSVPAAAAFVLAARHDWPLLRRGT